MTDLEKMELSLRRLAERIGKGIGGYEKGRLLLQIAEQIAGDEAERRAALSAAER